MFNINRAQIKSFYFDTLLTFSTLSDLPLIYLMRTSNTFDIDYNNPNVDWNDWPMWQNISDLCYGIGANKEFILPKRFVINYDSLKSSASQKDIKLPVVPTRLAHIFLNHRNGHS